MGYFDKERKLVKRPDDERPFDKNNHVDKKILSLIVISLSVLAVIIATFLLLFIFVF